MSIVGAWVVEYHDLEDRWSVVSEEVRMQRSFWQSTLRETTRAGVLAVVHRASPKRTQTIVWHDPGTQEAATLWVTPLGGEGQRRLYMVLFKGEPDAVPQRVLYDASRRETLNGQSFDVLCRWKETDRISATQADLDELKNLMWTNAEKLMRRGERLEDLVRDSEYLSETSRAFAQSSHRLTRRCCTLL